MPISIADAKAKAKYRASAKYRATLKRYMALPKTKAAQKIARRKHYEKHGYKVKPDIALAAVNRHNKRHPDRFRARYTVTNALRSGKLVRQPCEICGAPEAQAHHADYARPLDVRWRCFEHHLNEHSKKKVQG